MSIQRPRIHTRFSRIHHLPPHSAGVLPVLPRSCSSSSRMQLPPTSLQPARTYIHTYSACMHPSPPPPLPLASAGLPRIRTCASVVQRCAAMCGGPARCTAHHTSHHLASSIVHLASPTNQAQPSQPGQLSKHASGFIGGGGSQVPCREAVCRSRGLLGFGALCSVGAYVFYVDVV